MLNDSFPQQFVAIINLYTPSKIDTNTENQHTAKGQRETNRPLNYLFHIRLVRKKEIKVEKA